MIKYKISLTNRSYKYNHIITHVIMMFWLEVFSKNINKNKNVYTAIYIKYNYIILNSNGCHTHLQNRIIVKIGQKLNKILIKNNFNHLHCTMQIIVISLILSRNNDFFR